MAKILTALVALAALGFLAKMALGHKPGSLEDKEASAPKRQLDNVRVKAKDIEVNDQKYVDDALKKTESP